MTIDKTTRVGDIAANEPLSTRVFARHGIDFCCGGGRPLAEACERRGIDADAVLEEIRRETAPDGVPPRNWNHAPLGDLIDHIISDYHVPLREELPRLESMAAKVLQVHGRKRPDTLPRLVDAVVALRAELENHMAKEETILFPMIRDGNGRMAQGPIEVMEYEHSDAAGVLETLRELTGGYEVPEEACNTWRALWHGLADLERSLHEHIHLENNILFPRALAV